MNFLLRLLKRSEIKRYDHIVSLGYDCEIAYQMFKHNKFVESSLFAWAGIPSLQTLLDVLSDIGLIGKNGYEGPDANAMYSCNTTKILFHGKTKLKEFQNTPEKCQADKEELIGRLSFLKNKFISVAQENSHKLYVLKIKSSETDIEQKIEKLQRLLNDQNKGSFDLLLILEIAAARDLALTEKDNLYIRTISSFAPDSAVTGKYPSFKEWQKIFDEFVPLHKLKKKKRYKFEEVDQ